MVVTILLVIALVLAIVDEIRARGQNLTAWAVIIVAGVLLYGRL